MKTLFQAADTIRRPVKGAQAPPMSKTGRAHTTTLPQITQPPTAIVYCQGNFAKIDGKTANGLVRHSQVYKILSVIDSDHSGQDSGLVLDDAANQIPIFKDLHTAVGHAAVIPDTLIYGMAPQPAGCHRRIAALFWRRLPLA